ncbi:hypothetical protein RKD35_005419 [Streptomyces albogriseolus]
MTVWPSRVSSAASPARASRSRRAPHRASRVARARLTPPRASATRSRTPVRTVGVGDVEPGDHLGHRAQPVGEFVEPGGERGGLGGGGDRLDAGVQPLQAGVVGGEGVLAAQERHGALPEGREVALGLGGERVDAPMVRVPHLLQGQQVALGLAEFGEAAHPGGGLAGLFAPQPAHHGGDPFGGLVERPGRPAGEVGDRLELGEHLRGGGAHLLQRGAQVADLGVAQPVVGVQGAHAGGGEGRVDLGGGGGLGGGAGQRQAVGDAAHQVGVAHPGQRSLPHGPRGGAGVGQVRRVPLSHGVHAGGFVALGAQQGEAPVVEEGPAVAGHRGGDGLADLVVGEQQGASARGRVEGVEHVLAVRGAHLPLELHALGVEVVGLVAACGEAVAAGEDDALVLGQPAAALADAVEADDGAGEGVEDQMAVCGLLVGEDPQQDQRADAGMGDVGVGERLQRLVDGLAVDAVGRAGVVLRLHGEGAAEGVDEHLAPHGDVRVAAEDVVLAGGGRPREAGGRDARVVAVAAGVEEGGLAVLGDRPAQDANVAGLLAGLEDGEQRALDAAQPQQAGLPVVAVQGGELPLERGVVEQAGHGVLGQPVQVAVVCGEDVAHGDVPLRAGAGFIAEEQHVADGDDVAGHGGAPGAQPLGAGEAQLGRAELLGPAPVQRLGAAGEFTGAVGEAVAQHLVGAAVDRRAGPPRSGVRGGRVRGGAGAGAVVDGLVGAGGHGCLSEGSRPGAAVPCAAAPGRVVVRPWHGRSARPAECPPDPTHPPCRAVA